MYEDLKDMLCAWVVARSDEGLGYMPGVAKIAAMLLLNMAPAQAFVVMRNLLERHCLRCFYGGLASKAEVCFLQATIPPCLTSCRSKRTTGNWWSSLR